MRNEEIDILDLLRYVMTKWRKIIIAALVCAILFGAYGFIKAPKTAAAVADSITEERKDELKGVGASIKQYEAIKHSQEDYLTNSIYQNLDPFATKTIVLSYYIDNGYVRQFPVLEDNKDNTVPIVQKYVSVLQSSEFFKTLAKEVKDVEPSYYEEIIDFDLENQASGYCEIVIYGNNDKDLTRIAEIVKDTISEAKGEVEALYGAHTVKLASENKMNTVNIDIYDAQQATAGRAKTIDSEIAALKEPLSEEELSYLENEILATEDEKAEAQAKAPESKLDIKMVVIGALLGIFAVVVFYAIKYMFSKKLRNAMELQTVFNVPILTSIEKQDENAKLTKFDRKMNHKAIDTGKTFDDISKMVDVVATQIKIVADKNEYKKIAIITNGLDSYYEGIIDTLIKETSKNIEVVNVKDILVDTKELLSMSNASAAVLVEQLSVSKYDDIQERMKLCKEYNIDIIGSIVLQ